MQPLLYGELASWYRMVDPPADHLDEGICFQLAFERAVSARPQTLLELGAGAGHNAFHLKGRFDCTLTDLSEPMLALSRELNPECEHLLGDMRTLRLGRAFDAVLIHDAIASMTTAADLRAAVETAFAHTRPGGAAIFAPDALRERFSDHTGVVSADSGNRALRGLIWTTDPDPADDTCTVDFALLLREGAGIRAAHDRHLQGLFRQATWLAIVEGAGYRAQTMERPLGGGAVDEVFLCRRPG